MTPAPDAGERAAAAPRPTVHERILLAADYPSFARLLRESGCRRCALAGARTHIVVDRGEPAAGILVVGEAPGEQEDLAGRAFVGRAGRVLDELLRAVGLDPVTDVLIANVVKCRPPANRVPRAGEVAACRPYLHRQIELARPHTLLLLGATALRHFAGPGGAFALARTVGQGFALEAWPGIDFFSLYHPAYLLRSPGKRPLALGHLQRVREALRTRGRWPGSAPLAPVARPRSRVV